MKLFLVFCGLLGCLLPWRAVAGPADSLLTALNQALAHKKDYDGQRLNRIAVLTAEFASAEVNDDAKFALALRIYDEYKAFKYDSAFAYCQKITRLAAQLRNPEKIEVAKLKLAFVLLSSGLFKETFETLGRTDPQRLTAPDRQQYYFLLARAYSDLGDFNQDQTYRPAYHAKALAYADTALQLARPGSYDALLVQEFRAQKSNDLAAGMAVYRRIRQLPRLANRPNILVGLTGSRRF